MSPLTLQNLNGDISVVRHLQSEADLRFRFWFGCLIIRTPSSQVHCRKGAEPGALELYSKVEWGLPFGTGYSIPNPNRPIPSSHSPLTR